MPASRTPYSERPFWQRWYASFLHWLWFGPLTRDLYPYRPLEEWRRPEE